MDESIKSGMAAAMESQSTLDRMKEALEQLKHEKYIFERHGSAGGNITKTKTKDQLAATIAEQVYKLTEELESTKKFLEEVQNIRFTKGDAVFHRKFGACVVMGIEFTPVNAIYRDLTIEGLSVKLAHSEGVNNVPVSEVLPSTETSKAIYGK
jgi:hypothetical protein